MYSLQDLLGQDQGTQAVDQISQSVGVESTAVNSAIQAALPLLLGGLANNASTPQGAASLGNALDRDHSEAGFLGSLGGLSDVIFGPQATPRQADGGGILGHIFGNSQGQVAQEVSNKSGLSISQVAPILIMLAPIVMNYLGQQKQQQGVGADGLGGLLGGLLGGGQQQAAAASFGNPVVDMASNMLDSDRDGSSLDDIASIALNYMTKK